MFGLPIPAIVSVLVLLCVYVFLITEKINKAVVAMLGASALILTQVFVSKEATSQENAFEFISHNLDILGFVIGMMMLVGIVRESGVFEAAAIWLVKLVKGQPKALLIVIGYLTLGMTAMFSNIPTVLILTPVLIVLIRQLKLPYWPYIMTMVVMANIGGAMTPISDPTTYYQAKTVGLTFMEVLSNSGMIVMALSVVTLAYVLVVFRKELDGVKVRKSSVKLFKPSAAIKDTRTLWVGMPLLIICVFVMMAKESIFTYTGIGLDNATVVLTAAFVAMLLFHKKPGKVFGKLIDWEIIFFFMGLFVVVGALEFTHVIDKLALAMVAVTEGSMPGLLFLVTTGSAVLSTFIDNVPYNITMVGAIQAMEVSGLEVYPLWWGLNLGTSIGGAGSVIAAACCVIAFGQAEKDGMKFPFGKYLFKSLPLVVINSLVAFLILWLRYLA